MRNFRNWLWLLPALAGGIPATLAVSNLVQGEVREAVNHAITAAVLGSVALLVTGLFTGAVRAWVNWLAESLVSMFNFRAGGITHQMWQLPVGVAGIAGLYAGFKLHFNAATVTHVYVLAGALAFLALYAAVYLLHTRWAKPAFAGAGVVAIVLGLYLWNHKSSQIELYNQGLQAMDQGDLAGAMKLFDESVAAYKRESGRSQLAKLIFPEPNKDLEARAYFQKGNCLVKAQKPAEAVKAYKESLASNPGNNFSGLSMEGAALRYNDHLHTAANLEKLFSSGQSGGQARGNGRGQGQPQPGPGRDRQPSPGAGRQPRDSL